MAIGPFSSSETKATDNRISATDQAQVTRSGVIANPYSTAKAAKGKLIETGGIDLAGNKGDVLFQSSDPDVLNKALGAVENISAMSLGRVAELSTGFSESLNQQQSLLSSLAESKQTGGESLVNKTILWVVLGVLALLGVVFFRR